MQNKRNFWDKLFHCSHKEQNMDSFSDWLVEQRLNYLTNNGSFTSEDTLLAELTAELTKADTELTADEKTCLALFIDRVEHEKQMAYQQGLLDGITLVKAIHKV